MASNNSLVDQQTGLYERHLKKLHDVCLAKLIIAMQAQKEATNSQSRSKSDAKVQKKYFETAKMN